jgi:DNA uptake protein ComE-like DNA-binding protein
MVAVAMLVTIHCDASSVVEDIKRALEPGKGDLIVNVNTGVLKELETIPCIGAKLAREIIRSRPYEKIDDLKKVKGIGDYITPLIA